MKKFTEQLQRKAKTVSLQTAERDLLRERVISYMEYYPVKGGMAQLPKSAKPARLPLESYRVLRLPFHTKHVFQTGFAFTILMFMTTPVMAERAVPGDLLYPIKTQVNESVRSTFAFTPHQKVAWETELVNRRLAEARTLVREGKLTSEVEVEIAAALKTHTENVTREIAALRAEDEEEAVLAELAFATTLEVQSAALEDSQGSAEVRNTTLLENIIKDTLDSKSETVDSNVLSHQTLMARVEINTTRVYELFESISLDQGSDSYKNIQRRVVDIERGFEEVLQLNQTGPQASVPLLLDLLERSQRLIVLLSEVQVNQVTEIEKYVPVVLTPEERQSYIDRAEKDIADQRAFIIAQQENIVPTEIEAREKVTTALERLVMLENSLQSQPTFTDKQAVYEEMLAIGRDTIEIFNSLDIRFDPTATSTLPIPTEATTTPPVPVVEGVSTSTEEVPTN